MIFFVTESTTAQAKESDALSAIMNTNTLIVVNIFKNNRKHFLSTIMVFGGAK